MHAFSPIWSGLWRGTSLRVETAAPGSDRGAILRVGPAPREETGGGAPAEWLRFDCRVDAPHWVIDPSGRSETRPLDERVDIEGQVFALLEANAATLLAEIEGAPALGDAASGDAAVLREAQRMMRHRPAILEDLDTVVLRARRSEKWHTYPPDVLPVWVAEMDFPAAAPIQDTLRRFVESSDLGYPMALRDTGLPDVFCERMEDRFGWQPDPLRVEILSEVVQGIYLAIEAYSEPGQGVVVQTPIYPPFLGSIRDTGRRLVDNPMRLSAKGIDFDLDGLAETLDPECRLLLFCNPHNPSGRVYERAELERVAELAVRHDLVVVSDEIHGDLVYEGRRHIPIASLGPEIARRTVTLTSASKAFNIPGLRTAVAHFGSPELQRRFNTVVPQHARGGIGLLGLDASIAAWRWAQPWLDEVLPYLSANRDVAEQALLERLPEIRFLRPEATFLAWLDCTALGLEDAPAAHFLRHGRVALSQGEFFGEDWKGFARLNLATSRTILLEAVERMAKAVGR